MVVYLVGSFYTVHFGHHDIHDGHVRIEFSDSVESYLAIFRLEDFPVGLLS